MNAQIIAAAILVHLVRADFAGSISTAGSLANSLSSQVNGWSSPDGLVGALAIQNGFGAFSDAIISLSSAGGSLSDNDVDPASIGAFATSVANLLGVLTAKAGDFNSVGASSIVSNDIQQLGSPAAGILSDIITAASADCPKVSSLSGAYSAVVNGFSSADAAYSIADPSFPAFPSTCAGGASSAPASSAPASSAPGSSAPASSAPASSAPASSAASSAAASASSVASSAASAASSAASVASSVAASASSAPASSAPVSSAPASSSAGGGVVGPIGGNSSSVVNSTTPVPPVTSSPGGPIINGTNPGGAKTTTVDTTKWVTIPCSTPTTVTYGGSTYTVTKATTLTVKDCGCTDTVPGSHPTGGAGGAGGAPSGPAVASTKPGNPAASGVPIANKGFQNAVGLSAGVVGIVALLI